MAQFSGVSTRMITIFGGSGFLGRHMVRAFAKRGWRVKVAVRRPDLALFLQPLGLPGQIGIVQANLRHPRSVAAALRGAQAAVNCVGILSPSARQSFDGVHVDGAHAIAKAARDAGLGALVHVSAVGADRHSPSHYARSKGLGEEAIIEAFPGASVLRPSIVFGPEDDFFNRFASLARITPVLPLIGGGHTRFQPVFVGDVAEAAVRLVEAPPASASPYELGGPEILTFRQVLEYICRVIGRRRHFVSIPFNVARIVPALASEVADRITFGKFPQSLVMTRDQVTLLEAFDSIVPQDAIVENRTLQGLGISPTAMEAVVPSYLYRFRKTGQFGRQSA